MIGRMRNKIIIGFVVIFLLIIHFNQEAPSAGDWPLSYAILPTSELHDNLLTVRNIRNFKYGADESVVSADYYDRTYDINRLVGVWYIYEPFGQAAHNLLSFEFEDDIFLTVSIEARTNKNQSYDAYAGVFRVYPLIYVLADEKDAIFVRANVRKNQVVMYPTDASPEEAKLLLLNMMKSVNEISIHPKWYNTLNANCTSLIATHVNDVWPGTIPYSLKLLFTGYSDEIVYDKKWILTDLPLKEAKDHFNISGISNSVGYSDDYSRIIRKNIRNKR
jgi:hypothetical protein